MTQLLMDAALKGSVVLTVAWIATVLLRHASADLRHRIWLVALAGTVLVSIPLPMPAPVRIAVNTNFVITSTASAASASAASWIRDIWILGFGLVLIRFAAGVLRLARITRTARESGREGALVSDSVTSPLTWGTIHPVVLLPSYAMEWPEEKLDVVLRHERAHVERRDWLSQAFAQVVTALFWFHPLAWLAAERLRQEAEHATDDMVLAGGSDAAGYANQLVEVARRIQRSAPHPVTAAVTMVRPSALTARVAAILDSSRTRVRAGVRARATVGLAAACLVALLAVCQHAKAQVYRVSPGVTSPVALVRVQPSYSEAARKAKWQGTVTVSLIVDAQGRPQDVRVVKALGFGLDEMAVEAVQKWTFKPGEKDGKPVPVEATIEINFRLL
jgi:TonB family protein